MTSTGRITVNTKIKNEKPKCMSNERTSQNDNTDNNDHDTETY